MNQQQCECSAPDITLCALRCIFSFNPYENSVSIIPISLGQDTVDQKIDPPTQTRFSLFLPNGEREAVFFLSCSRETLQQRGLDKTGARGPERGSVVLTSPLWSPCRRCATGTYHGSPRCQSSGGGPGEEMQTGAHIPLLHITAHPHPHPDADVSIEGRKPTFTAGLLGAW